MELIHVPFVIPLVIREFSNFADVNGRTLTVITVSGKPKRIHVLKANFHYLKH